jgi:hypothetical protein
MLLCFYCDVDHKELLIATATSFSRGHHPCPVRCLEDEEQRLKRMGLLNE